MSSTEISQFFARDGFDAIRPRISPLSSSTATTHDQPAAFDSTALYLMKHIPLPNDPQLAVPTI